MVEKKFSSGLKQVFASIDLWLCCETENQSLKTVISAVLSSCQICFAWGLWMKTTKFAGVRFAVKHNKYFWRPETNYGSECVFSVWGKKESGNTSAKTPTSDEIWWKMVFTMKSAFSFEKLFIRINHHIFYLGHQIYQVNESNYFTYISYLSHLPSISSHRLTHTYKPFITHFLIHYWQSVRVIVNVKINWGHLFDG